MRTYRVLLLCQIVVAPVACVLYNVVVFPFLTRHAHWPGDAGLAHFLGSLATLAVAELFLAVLATQCVADAPSPRWAVVKSFLVAVFAPVLVWLFLEVMGLLGVM